MNNDMFRYLEKYVGTYRVLTELDYGTKDFPRDHTGKIDTSFDDLYIPCNKGIIKHSYKPHYLVWYSNKLGLGRSVKREFEEKHIEIFDYDESDSEVLIWFDEKDFKKVASIIKPKTKGKKISPFSSRNLTKHNNSTFSFIFINPFLI